MRADAIQRLIVLMVLIFSVVLPASADERAEHGDWTSQFLDGWARPAHMKMASPCWACCVAMAAADTILPMVLIVSPVSIIR